jgi:cell division protein FtsL
MRILHLLVIGILVFAAAYVYRIKMESTVRTERVLRLHADIREQRDAIAALRAEWTRLDAPLRLQGLVERHLPLKPVVATQYDSLKNLPERPARLVQPNDPDPIGSMISAVAAVAAAAPANGAPANGAAANDAASTAPDATGSVAAPDTVPAAASASAPPAASEPEDDAQ